MKSFIVQGRKHTQLHARITQAAFPIGFSLDTWNDSIPFYDTMEDGFQLNCMKKNFIRLYRSLTKIYPSIFYFNWLEKLTALRDPRVIDEIYVHFSQVMLKFTELYSPSINLCSQPIWFSKCSTGFADRFGACCTCITRAYYNGSVINFILFFCWKSQHQTNFFCFVRFVTSVNVIDWINRTVMPKKIQIKFVGGIMSLLKHFQS